MRISLISATALLAGLAAAAIDPASAAPERIIILRHGEKADAWKLCDVGQQRAAALVQNYLGRGAANSLFASGNPPAAFFAVTLHTLELASPAASSWGMPLLLYSATPIPGQSNRDRLKTIGRRTQEAVQDILQDSRWRGKTVVMVWEHDHIASAKLEQEFAPEQITLRQLLKLDRLSGMPTTWPSENYDYFWIVDFAGGSEVPTAFRTQKQSFPAPFEKIPANDWGKPNGLTKASGCIS